MDIKVLFTITFLISFLSRSARSTEVIIDNDLSNSIASLIEGRGMKSYNESSNVVPLLMEIKELLIAHQMSPEQRWRKEFDSFTTEIKSSVQRLQAQVDNLSKSSNQKVDIMLQAFSGVGIQITNEMKKVDDLWNRIRQTEEKLHDLEKQLTKNDKSEHLPSGVSQIDSVDIPIPSSLIVHRLSASVPESPQAIPFDNTKVTKADKIDKGNADKVTPTTLPNTSLEDTLEKMEMDITRLKMNSSSFHSLLSNLKLHHDTLEQNMAEINQSSCSCDKNIFENDFGDINRKIDIMKMDFTNIQRFSNQSRDIFQEYVASLHTKNNALNTQIQEIKTQLSDLTMKYEGISFTNELNSLEERVKRVETVSSLSAGTGFGLSHRLSQILSKNNRGLCVWPFVRDAGSCFYVSKDKRLSWKEARTECEKIQGDLAAPQNIKDFTQFLSQQKLSRSYSYWLGASDAEKEDHWVWVDGRPVPHDSGLWATNQPNEGKSSNCMSLKMTSRGVATSDDDCLIANYFVCEQERTTFSTYFQD